MRLGGLTLALATLGLAFIGDRLVFQLEGVRNGSRGWSIPRPAYGPVDLSNDKALLVVLLVLVAAVAGLVGNLARSATGRAVLALRSSSVAASTSGVDPVRTKLVLFGLSAGLAGFAGALFAMVNSPITNTSAPPLLGVIWLAVAVTFGIRRPGGAVVAGLVYAIVPVVLTGIGETWAGAPWSAMPDSVRRLIAQPELAMFLFGLGAVGLSLQPDGVLADIGHGLRERRVARAGAGAHSDEAGHPTTPTAEQRGAPGGVVGGPGATAEAARPVSEAVHTVRSPVEEVAGAGHRRAGAGSVAPSSSSIAPASGSAAALALVGVRAGYGEVEVLHGVDLTVPAGGVVAVLGANGAGKSTLCGVAGGLLTPTAGEVWFDGRDVTARGAHLRARDGLLLAPEARGVFPGLSVEDNLAIRLRAAADRQVAYDCFPILGERRTQLAGLLSGGEQQQLALAGALARPRRCSWPTSRRSASPPWPPRPCSGPLRSCGTWAAPWCWWRSRPGASWPWPTPWCSWSWAGWRGRVRRARSTCPAWPPPTSAPPPERWVPAASAGAHPGGNRRGGCAMVQATRPHCTHLVGRARGRGQPSRSGRWVRTAPARGPSGQPGSNSSMGMMRSQPRRVTCERTWGVWVHRNPEDPSTNAWVVPEGSVASPTLSMSAHVARRTNVPASYWMPASSTRNTEVRCWRTPNNNSAV